MTNEWVEPIDAYQCLRPAVLLDGMGAHPEARYAYVALDFAYEARLEGNELTIARQDGKEVRTGPPLELIQSLADEMYQPVEEPEGFTGGLVGYFGYEFVRAVEPTLEVHTADTPDALLWLAQSAVIFDRVERTWRVASQLGDERVAEIEAQIKPVAPATPQPIQAQWSTSLNQPTFEAAVERIRDHIAQGDLYQANIATRHTIDASADPVTLYRSLSASNPSPFMALMEANDHAIVSCSPEQLFSVRDGRIQTRPIAGTRPRADDDEAMEQELLSDPKERAEHTMLVDLLRNDIAKVSRPGTVHVPELMSVERYSHVMHLVSRIEGQLRPETKFKDWLAALFPGGTITGAPKHRACMRINEVEPVARGPYTGSAGFLSWSHHAHWNIMIRTIVLKGGLRVQAGSGIVADSVPEREWVEAGNKARALIEAATGARKSKRGRLGEVTPHGNWRHPTRKRSVEARVLLIDNYDSFIHNIADYCAALGATVRVLRNDEDWKRAMVEFDPTHIILGPGPGRPEDSLATVDILRANPSIPVLGICLGHQAMALVDGVDVEVGEPVHGKTAVVHDTAGLLVGLDPLKVTRYHSLVVPELPEGWSLDGRLEDGTIMAMQHPGKRWFGWQFHPESICTDAGLELLGRFLE